MKLRARMPSLIGVRSVKFCSIVHVVPDDDDDGGDDND